MEELLLQHFNQKDDKNTRAIVFVQFRESVSEITTMLKQHEPLIRAASFIGQSSGKSGQ